VANSSQDQIKRAYELAIAKGSTAKAEVLEKFILTEGKENGEQINERRESRHVAKHIDRDRAFKIDRPHKISTGRLPEQEETPVS
jgi:hypothetical protein